MNKTDQVVSLWLAPVTGLILLAGLALFPGMFPPMSPAAPAEAVAALYREHAGQIRWSMIICDIWGVMLIPFFMVIVHHMKRMLLPSEVLPYTYFAAAASGATMFAMSSLFWVVAAFRPERSTELLVVLNDLAWLTFVTPVGFILVQNLSLAFAIFMDALPRPIFPRWVAHFNILTALMMAPGALALIYDEGVFAWDGLFAFWGRMLGFILYVVVMFFVLRNLAAEEAREEAA